MGNETQKIDSLKERAAWVMVAKLIVFLFNIALPLLLVRKLSQENYGLYKQVFLVITTSVAILPFGFGMTAYYLLPREAENKHAVIFNILLYYLVIGTVALLTFALFPDLLANLLVGEQVASQNPHVRQQIIAFTTLIGVVILVSIFSSLLEVITIANQDIKLATIFIITSQLIKTSLFLTIALTFGTVRSLLYAGLVQGVLQSVILIYYLQRRFEGFWRCFDWSMFKRQLTYTMTYGTTGLIWTLQNDMHNYFVSHNFGQARFAIYAVGVFQLPLVGILNESVASVMIPRVNYLQSISNTREIINLTVRAMRGLAAVFFPLYAVLVVMRKEFIVTLFTDNYLASIPVFIIYLTLLPFSITPLDAISRAFIEIGRFLVKIRITSFIVLITCLWLAAQYQDLRYMIGVVVIVCIIENLLTFYKSSKVLGVEVRDYILLKDLCKIALSSIIAASITYLSRMTLLQFEVGPFWLLSVCCSIFGVVYWMAFLGFRIATVEEKKFVFRKFAGVLQAKS